LIAYETIGARGVGSSTAVLKTGFRIRRAKAAPGVSKPPLLAAISKTPACLQEKEGEWAISSKNRCGTNVLEFIYQG